MLLLQELLCLFGLRAGLKPLTAGHRIPLDGSNRSRLLNMRQQTKDRYEVDMSQLIWRKPTKYETIVEKLHSASWARKLRDARKRGIFHWFLPAHQSHAPTSDEAYTPAQSEQLQGNQSASLPEVLRNVEAVWASGVAVGETHTPSQPSTIPRPLLQVPVQQSQDASDLAHCHDMLAQVDEHVEKARKLLFALAQNDNAHIRMRVAENHNTTQDALWLLSVDADPQVRCRVAENKNCPRAILEMLAADPNGCVRSLAEQKLRHLWMNATGTFWC